MKFDFWTVILVVSTGFGDDQYLGGGGGMVVASMYPASRIDVKPINCEHTSILVDNMLLLEPWDMISSRVVWYSEHRYVYTKHVLNSTIIVNIKVYSLQKQCVIEALMCMFKTFWLNYKFLHCFEYLLILNKS